MTESPTWISPPELARVRDRHPDIEQDTLPSDEDEDTEETS